MYARIACSVALDRLAIGIGLSAEGESEFASLSDEFAENACVKLSDIICSVYRTQLDASQELTWKEYQMSRLKWGAKAVAVVAACSLALSACGGGSTEEPGDTGTATDTATDAPAAGGGTITAAAAYETTNYHPSSTSSALAMGSNWHVVEGLWELNMNTYEPFKALSASEDPVQVSDTVYEVTLREGAAFSDGTPVTAEDVVSSFGRATAEGNIYGPMLSFIQSVEAKDETTVTITLEFPSSLLKQRLPLVKIVPAGGRRCERSFG